MFMNFVQKLWDERKRLKEENVKINRKFFKYYDGLSVKDEAFLMFLQMGFLGSIFSTINAIRSNQGIGTLTSNALIIVVCIIFIILSRDTRNIYISKIVLLNLLGVVIFPALYFLSGQYNAVLYWDILLIALSSVCLEDKHRKITIVVQMIAMLLSMHIGRAHPELFGMTRNPDKIYFAVNVAYVFVSFTIIYVTGFVLKSVENLVTRLEESEKRAIRSEKAKTQFLASMSHEIRTPINAIIGLNQMNLDSDDLTTIKTQCEDIKLSSNLLLNIINDVLDFSKMEEGKFTIVCEDYSPNDLVREFSVLKKRATDKGLGFVIEKDEKTPLPEGLYGDSKRIVQIGFNIISNAIKYSSSGSVNIKLSYIPFGNKHVEANMDGKKYDGLLRIRVKDTGRGIKKEDLPYIFDAFQRLDETANHHTEGTGLGLAIVKNLVNLMQGYISVESEYGIGSTFTVDIPQKLSEYKESIFVTETPDFTNKSILCVDDNMLNLKVFKGLLKKTGCIPTVLSSGRDCIEYLKENMPDIIFMDIMMPEMSGEDCFKKIRQMGIKVPVIALTADAVDNAKGRYEEMGFSGYLSKPIDCIKLWETIKEQTEENA